MRTIALFSTAVALALACLPEKEVPAKPTWVDDVQPILQGSCFHCHGAEVGTKEVLDDKGKLQTVPVKPHGGEGGARYDIFELAPFKDALGDTVLAGMPAFEWLGMNISEAKTAGGSLAGFSKPTFPVNNRMPPAPALPLSDWEHSVLEKWSKNAVRGTRSPNAKPTVRKVAQSKQGADLILTFDVHDDDGDQVLGRVEAGTAKVPLLRSGRHTVTLAGAANDAPKWILCDGQDTVTR